MKKLVLLTICITVLLILVSCDIGNIHTHAYGEWETIKEATCTEDGQRVRSCSCGEIETEVISAKGHTEEVLAEKPATCTETGLTEGKKCSACGENTVKQTTIHKTGHTETVIEDTPATCTESGLTEGKKCSVCGEVLVKQETVAALGHDFYYNEQTDENGNTVTVAVCQRENCGEVKENPAGLYDADNKLLASWDELVNDYRLKFDHDDLKLGTKVIIDDSVTNISGTFENCTSLTDIYISKSVIRINPYTFFGCTSLSNIEVDKDNEHFKSIDGNLYTKDGTILVQYAVGKEDKEFTIPDGVTTIDYLAFGYCDEIENVVIPSSVMTIVGSIFYSCPSLKNIYFTGTAEEWEAIKYKTSWLPYNALVHYDGNKMFMAYGFAGDFGSSGASGLCQIITIRNNQVYIDAHGYDVLYDTITRSDSYEFEYGDRVYSYIENRKETEKLDILNKIKACNEFYILEGTNTEGMLQKRICCYIDGVFYLLTVSDTNEETGVPIISRINYAIFEWEE